MDLIIGAGISGIAYANFSNNKCLILEKEQEIGGYCRTIKRNNFIWDYSGHFFHFQNSQIEDLVCKNIEIKTLKTVRKQTSILYNDIYIDFPFQKNIHQLPKQEFIDCLYDLFTANPNLDSPSFKAMIYSNLGKAIADKFLVPYNEKLYACDLDLLDKDAMGRFFPKATKEDIIKNFKDNNNTSYNQTFVYSSGGAVEYINSLYQNIERSVGIDLNTEVTSIDLNNKIVYTPNETYKFDNLISSIPFPELLKKCGVKFDQSIFTSNKVLVLNIGFDRKGRDKNTSWLYIPSKDYIFYRVGFYDNILDTDQMSLYVEMGFPSDYELNSDEYYLEKVLIDLKAAHIINNEDVVDYEFVLMNPAYVHINSASTKEVLRLKNELSKCCVYSIGRYGSWTYCSIEDNIIEAKELAEKLNINI